MIPSREALLYLLCHLDGTDYISDIQVTHWSLKKKEKERGKTINYFVLLLLRLLSNPSL